MAITTRAGIQQNIAKGWGVIQLLSGTTRVGGTTANAGCGFMNIGFSWNSIGTTLYTTLQSFPLPLSLPNEVFHLWSQYYGGLGGCGLGYLYKIGTVDLTATGNQLTHDAATFPVVRTQLNAASQPVGLIPVVLITTATATTAPVFRLRTLAGAAGYVDQDGNSIVGTKTMTMPAAATAAGSGYIIRLEDGDSAVRDITNVEVTTAGTAGAATIYGLEILSKYPTNRQNYIPATSNGLFRGIELPDLRPATATSGTVTAELVGWAQRTTTLGGADMILNVGVLNV